MGQHPNPDPDPHVDDDLEALGTPVYEGGGLSVRALTAEELQQFLDAHRGQPAQPLGSGWALDPSPRHPLGVPRTPPAAELAPSEPLPSALAGPAAGSLGRPGRSALAQYRRRRAEERTAWTRSLAWRVPVVAAAGLTAAQLTLQAGLARVLATLAGLAVAAVVGLRLRFKPSEQARAWQRGAHGERRTARLLDRLTRDGYVVFHDLTMPGSPANVDHLVIGPTGVFVVDSKQWSGSVHQSIDGLVWHNHYRLDRTLEIVRWEAQAIGRLLGTRTTALLCVHGAHVHGGGLHAQDVAIVPARLLCGALGPGRVLSDADVTALATTVWTNLHPAV
jgi:hypothetical protein